MWKKFAMIPELGLQLRAAAESIGWDRGGRLRAGTPVEVCAETRRVAITTRSRKKRALIGKAIEAKSGDIDLRRGWLAAAGAVLGGGSGDGGGALTGGPVAIYRAP